MPSFIENYLLTLSLPGSEKIVVSWTDMVPHGADSLFEEMIMKLKVRDKDHGRLYKNL